MNGIQKHSSCKKCPYCGNIGYPYLKRYGEDYNRCRRCDLIFKDCLKSYHDLVESYRCNYYRKFSKEQNTGSRSKLFEYILDLIETDKSGGGNLLDIGTGYGFFLVSAKQRGWEVKGIEPSKQSANFAGKQSGIPVFQGTLREYSDKALFEAITFINVLDHSAEPWNDLKKTKILLKPKGTIYIRFPNGFLHSRLNRWAHKCGLGNKVDRLLIFHEFSFTPQFIKRLLSDFGFYKITILNSPPSEGDPYKLFPTTSFAEYIKRFVYMISRIFHKLSNGKILLGPSLEVIAIRK